MFLQKTFTAVLFISALIFSKTGITQTVFGTEPFGAGSAQGTLANGFVGSLGTWTVAASGANGASANQWYVSGEECGNAVNTCGTACPGGDNSLHISAIAGLCGVPDCGAAYDATAAANITNRRAISPTIDCSGKGGIVLNFNYIAAQGDDDFFVEYSLDNGGTWFTFTGGNVAASLCCPCFDAFFCGFFGICCGGAPVACSGLDQGYWTAASLNFPAGADGNPIVKFAFNWSNDGDGVGTDPSVAIDDITLTHAIILSVELANFSGVAEDNINRLSWNTLSENNADYFDVEYSVDGIDFSSIGQTNAKGNSNNKNEYSFLHQTDSRVNYYRLKNVDLDGAYSYSEIIEIENDLSGILLTRSGNEYIIKGLENSEGEISIYDLSGKKIFPPIQFDRETNFVEINFENFNAGIYIIDVNSSKGTKQFKVLM